MLREVLTNKVMYIAAAFAVTLILGYVAASSFIYPKCATEDCFKNQLWKCSRASFLNVRENSTWQYKINGLSDEKCEVYVKVVSMKTGVEAGTALRGKDMTCYIPKKLSGAFFPEERIEYCHGILKEEIQNLMIEKMHLYIIQNIGMINKTAIGAIFVQGAGTINQTAFRVI